MIERLKTAPQRGPRQTERTDCIISQDGGADDFQLLTFCENFPAKQHNFIGVCAMLLVKPEVLLVEINCRIQKLCQ